MILQGLTVGFLVVGLAAACCESKDAAAPYGLDEKGAAAQPGAARRPAPDTPTGPARPGPSRPDPCSGSC